MSPAAIRFALVALLCVLSWWAGWEWRDRSADLTVAERDRDDAKAVGEAVTEARTEDLASQAGTSPVEQQRVEQQAQVQTEFKYITREVIRYVQSNPSPAGCGLSADGLRIWRASSAGQAATEPDDPAGAAGPVP